MTRSSKSKLEMQVMWDRLIALVEDQANTLMKTAFSPIVRESGDLSAGIFDITGRMLAQARTGTPGHVNTMASSVAQFLKVFPIEDMVEGDVYVTNDPWIGTGHLNDYVVVTPSFLAGKVVAIFTCTGHMTDVGGIGLSPEASSLYAEGTLIPLSKLVDGGCLNNTLVDIAMANSRMPHELEGDLHALIASNATTSVRLIELLREVGVEDLSALSNHIIEKSKRAFEVRLKDLPKISATYKMRTDGFEQPIDLVATVTITDSGVDIDWNGSSSASDRGINVPLGYAAAYSSYAIACAIAPDIPNNFGTLSMIRVTAPDGSILNAIHPQPVSCRHIIGGLLPDVILGAFEQIVPGSVPAESSSALWTLTIKGVDRSDPYTISIVTTGGTGARPSADGLSATAFPSAVRGTPVEMVEANTPLVFWSREFRPNSGGDGEYRGGLGQSMEIGTRDGKPFTLVSAFDRLSFPARGRLDGHKGAPGEVRLSDGTKLPGKGSHAVDANLKLIIGTPGGGGYGKPENRKVGDREKDLLFGYVTC